MLSEDAKDLIISLGKCISEVRFKKTPDRYVLDFLFDECDETAISFDLRIRLPLMEYGEFEWAKNVISAHLSSDGFSDWEAIPNFIKLRELVLTVVPYDPDYVDTRDVADMQLALLNLPDLRSLVVDIAGFSQEATALIEQRLIFPCSQIAFELKKKTSRRTKRRPV